MFLCFILLPYYVRTLPVITKHFWHPQFLFMWGRVRVEIELELTETQSQIAPKPVLQASVENEAT